MGDGFDFQCHLLRRLGDAQGARFQPVGAFRQRLAVHAQLHQFQFLAIQHQFVAAGSRVALQGQPAGDAGGGRIKVETEFHRLHQIRGRGVIFAIDGGGGVGAHEMG